MPLPWAPIVWLDAVGSVLTLILALACAHAARGWAQAKKEDVFRHYLFLLTLAIAFFAISRSVGHLFKQLLLMSGHATLWHRLSPYSGALNSLTFGVIFAFSLYWQRVQWVHRQFERYRDHLEEMIAARTQALEEANRALEQEVVERQAAEQALNKSREYLQAILDNTTLPIYLKDIEGRYVMVNRRYEELAGVKAADVIGKDDPALFPPEIARVFREQDREVIAAGRPLTFEETIMLQGREYTFLTSKFPLRDQGRIYAVGGVCTDITGRKEAEERQLRLERESIKAKKLESVGVLAGGIAHDFNNILAAILGNISLLRLEAGFSDKAAAMLEDAERACVRAKDLTQQLLTFSKGGEPVRETASLAEVVRDSAAFILHGGTVGIEFDIADDLWLVDIDKGQISQVIQNMILNAKQAMADGGLIRVRCRNGGADVLGGPAVVITIADQGPGIAPADLERIFDPYFTTKSEGNGLGLAICHSIVSKHHGRIAVECPPGGGTVFTIHLPAAAKNEQAGSTAAAAPPPPVAAARLLVMDDEEMVRNVAKAMLAQLGHEVTTCADGAEALRLYQEAREQGREYDAVIMDLTIPGGMGGEEAAARLLDLAPAARLIVSSGYSTNPVLANFADYGFCAAIVKPYRLPELAAALARALG